MLLRTNYEKRASIQQVMKYCEQLQNSSAPMSAIEQYEKNELKKVYKLNKGIKESQTVEQSDKKVKENVEPKKY